MRAARPAVAEGAALFRPTGRPTVNAIRALRFARPTAPPGSQCRAGCRRAAGRRGHPAAAPREPTRRQAPVRQTVAWGRCAILRLAHMALTVGRPRRAEKRSAFRRRTVAGYVVGDVGRCERLARRWRKALRFSALRAVQQSTPYERCDLPGRPRRQVRSAARVAAAQRTGAATLPRPHRVEATGRPRSGRLLHGVVARFCDWLIWR